MEYMGKKICGIEIVDETKDNKLVAYICDGKTETTNGYKVRVVPFNKEVKAND